jgi:hypothetical protein
MATKKTKKSRPDDLFERLRAVGLRKQVAKTLASASDKADSKRVRKAVEELRNLVGELESRVGGVVGGTPKEPEPKSAAKRSGGAPERAKTTTAKPASADAAKRSAAAKKAAATRAANRARAGGGTATTRSTPERATTTRKQRAPRTNSDGPEPES